MSDHIDALRTSVQRLVEIVGPLDDHAITQSAYPTEWTIAQVMSHLGSGATIMQRRIDDALAGVDAPDDFAPSIWDVWNAKSPRAQVDDGLAADAAYLARIESVSDEDRSGFAMALGPMSFDFDEVVGLRLNEHIVHTWDIEVALHPEAALPGPAAAVIVDRLELVAGYTAKSVGAPGTIVIRTTEPDRWFTLEVTPGGAVFTPSTAAAGTPDIELPAEAFARLAHGRLDGAHTPPFTGDEAVIERLRAIFPGV